MLSTVIVLFFVGVFIKYLEIRNVNQPVEMWIFSEATAF